jgi:peptidoglycan/LPS O-acetylase OafA/YrhL
MPPYKSDRLDYLDTTRGLAALAVVVMHYFQEFGTPRAVAALSLTPIRAFWDGGAAVQLFFVLSGLVLSLRYFRTSIRPDMQALGLSAYVVARCCRIWLPYAAVIAITMATRRLMAGWFQAHGTTADSLAHLWYGAPQTVKGILHQLVLFRLSSPADPRFTLIPQAWSLANEMILSSLVPAGVLIAARGNFWLAFTLTAAIGCAGLTALAAQFGLGILIAKNHRVLVAFFERRAVARSAMLVVSLMLYTSAPHFARWGFGLTLTYELVALGAGGLLLFTMSSPGTRRAFSLPGFRDVGRTSYSIYLIHVAVIVCLTPIVHDGAGGMWGLGLAATLLISVLIAHPLYRFIEVPTIQLGRRASAAAAEWSMWAMAAMRRTPLP